MSRETYERGVRDGQNDSTAGKPSKPIILEIVEGYTEKELQDIKDWKQGFEHGQKSQ